MKHNGPLCLWSKYIFNVIKDCILRTPPPTGPYVEPGRSAHILSSFFFNTMFDVSTHQIHRSPELYHPSSVSFQILHFYCLPCLNHLYWVNILSTVPWNLHIMNILNFCMLINLLCTFSSHNMKDKSFFFNSSRIPIAFHLILYVKQHESSLKREIANY
jgi:hypothetical protein